MMESMMQTELRTNEVFERLTVPSNRDEREQLEMSLLSLGCLEPIVTWKGMILDGHKRYKICQTEGIDFRIKEIHFQSMEDAILWACKERAPSLPRYRLLFKYLVGKWYSMCIVIHQREMRSFPEKCQIGRDEKGKQKYRSSIDASRELGIHRTTIENYKSLTAALDTLAKKDQAFFDLLIQDRCRLSLDRIRQISTWDKKRLADERRRALNAKALYRSRKREIIHERRFGSETYMENAQPIKVGIKDMPAYDPDMELKGLALTIPTWMNAMTRAKKKTDMNLASHPMKQQLWEILFQFRKQIDQIMEVL